MKTEMTREKLKSIFDALRNDPSHHLGLGDIRLTIAQQDEILNLIQPIPPVEGASPSSATAEEKEAEIIVDEWVHEYCEGRVERNEMIATIKSFAALAVAEATKELLKQRDELREALAEQKRIYFNLFDEEVRCMYCEAPINRGSAIILCKECAENTEV